MVVDAFLEQHGGDFRFVHLSEKPVGCPGRVALRAESLIHGPRFRRLRTPHLGSHNASKPEPPTPPFCEAHVVAGKSWRPNAQAKLQGIK